MIYKWAVIRNGLLLDRTLTESKARKIAAMHAGAIVLAAMFVTGCAAPRIHTTDVPCDRDNCGKSPLDKQP